MSTPTQLTQDFDVASYTRKAFNKHRTSSRWSTAGDVYQTLLGAVILLAYAGSLLYGVQQDLVADSGWFLTRPLVSERFTLLPASIALDLLFLLAASYGLLLACRVGPISVTRAQGYWWLNLPVERRKLLQRPALMKVLWTSCAAGLAMIPVSALAGPADGIASVLLASLAAMFLGVFVLTIAAAVQLSAAQRVTERSVRVLSGIVIALLLMPAILPDSTLLTSILSAVLPALPSSWPLAVAHGGFWPLSSLAFLSLIGTTAVYSRLGLFRKADLVAAGGVTGHASSALYFMDFRELGQSLAASGTTPSRFTNLRWAPSSAAGVLILADLVAFIRKPHALGALVALSLFPGALALVEGLGSAILMAVVLLLCGWRVAALSAAVASTYADRPFLNRMLPLGDATQLRLHAATPLLVAVCWSVIAFGLLLILGGGSHEFNGLHMLAMALIAGVGLAGAAVRMAYKPSPDWVNVVGTPLAVLQTNGVSSSFTRGPDFVFLAMLPVLLALMTGTLTLWLVLLQIASSALCLWLGTRRSVG